MTTTLKKAVLLGLLLILPLAACMAGTGSRRGGNAPRQRISSLIQEFKACDGFEAIRVGPVLLSVAKPFIRAEMKQAVDEEERAEMQLALDAINSIKRVQVAVYSGCDEDVRRKFDARLSRLLDRMDLLMEVCDGQDRVRMFGSVSGNGRYLNDFIIHVPTDGALVCLYGRLDLEVISEIIEKEMQ